MSNDAAQGEPVSDAGATQPLRLRLERFGDPGENEDWRIGKVNYVARIGVTASDVPELLAIARHWVEPFESPEDENDFTPYAPIHAWRCLAQLRAVEAVGPLLEMMDSLDKLDDDWYMDEFPDVFAWIGPASLAPLWEYLADERHGLYPRTCAASSLKELALRHGQLRDDAVKALSGALARFEQNDLMFNGFLIACLMDLKAVEAAEVIERAHAAGRVETFVCGCWDTVRKELGVEGLGLVPPELAKPQRLWFRDDTEDDDPPEEDFVISLPGETPFLAAGPLDDSAFPDEAPLLADDPLAEPELPLQRVHEVGRNDPCPCGSGKKYKKCCLR
jgi:hypothetical protein